jgi:GTPase SAR1 family protein
MGREPKLIVAVGKKGVGKTYLTEKIIQQYVKGNPSKGVPPRRALILDVNDEFSNIKAIAINDVIKFSAHPIIEARRVRPFHANGKKMTLDDISQTLFIILDTYREGLLLIEDINKYIADTMPNDLVGAICTNRHIGVDIILHYQSIGRITTKVWQNLNVIRFHKITDSVAKHANKYEDKIEYLSLAEIMVNQEYANGNIRFFVYVDVDREKVLGNYTDEMYEKAAQAYISKNYTNLINPLLKERDEKGKKMYDNATAYNLIKQRLMSYKK